MLGGMVDHRSREATAKLSMSLKRFALVTNEEAWKDCAGSSCVFVTAVDVASQLRARASGIFGLLWQERLGSLMVLWTVWRLPLEGPSVNCVSTFPQRSAFPPIDIENRGLQE